MAAGASEVMSLAAVRAAEVLRLAASRAEDIVGTAHEPCGVKVGAECVRGMTTAGGFFFSYVLGIVLAYCSFPAQSSSSLDVLLQRKHDQ